MKKKVLIIEDDEDVSRVYEIKLAKEGVETDLAIDGEAGFAKIRSFNPDVVLLDLMIPKRDGFWVLEQVKANPELKNTKIIVLSNLGQEQDKDRAFSLGAMDYLVKADISIKEVIDKIKKNLNDK
jgi:DNA-binding response OmpR family regulator